MIITGAPVENLDFTDVDYWDELCQIMEWTKTHVHPRSTSAGGPRPGCTTTRSPNMIWAKSSSASSPIGWCAPSHRCSGGFDDIFYIPHSRYTENRLEDIQRVPELELLAISEQAESLPSRVQTIGASLSPDTRV